MASDFGSGLGSIIGGGLASDDISAGMGRVAGLGGDAWATLAPFYGFGQGLLGTATNAINKVQGAAGDTPQFGDFMKNFQMSDGAKYTLGQTLEATDMSAAARGGLLSGANLRARSEIANDITSKDIAQQYQLTLQGDQQQFGQLVSGANTALAGVGVGSSAAGTYVGSVNSQMNAQAQLAAAQAKADSSKGSGIGSMFSGIAGMASKF